TVSLGPCTPATSTEAIRLAEEALDIDRKCAWNFHALGMARYRANQFDEAIKAIQASLDADPNWEGVACNWLVMAMACHRLGQTDQAEEWLKKSVKWMEEATSKLAPGVVHPLPGMHEHDSLACYVLRREAEGLIRGKKE